MRAPYTCDADRARTIMEATAETKRALMGSRSVLLRRLRTLAAGRASSLANAKIDRDTAAWSATVPAMNPRTMVTRRGLVIPSPRLAVRVVVIGSGSAPDMAAPISGIARSSARHENVMTDATVIRDVSTARGTLRSGDRTSSAMAPALSKPTNDQPMIATAARNGPKTYAVVSGAVPKDSRIVLREFRRWKMISTNPTPRLAMTSHTMLTVTSRLSHFRPAELAMVLAKRMTAPSTIFVVVSGCSMPSSEARNVP